MGEMTFDDLIDEAGEAAQDAATDEQGTGEWVRDVVELLDRRSLLEPILFGPEQAQELQEAHEEVNGDGEDPDAEPVEADADTFDADSIAAALGEVENTLGPDTTVEELREICEDRPDMVNERLAEAL